MSGIKYRSASCPLYCGPYALAAVSKMTYEMAENAVQNYRRKRGLPAKKKVRGMWNAEMNDILQIMFAGRVTTTTLSKGSQPTLAAWLKGRSPDSVYVVNVTGHYVVIYGNRFVDNQVGQSVGVRQAPHRRKRVCQFWTIDS